MPESLELPKFHGEELTEESVTGYLSIYQDAADAIDFLRGEILYHARNQWGQPGVNGRFKSYCENSPALVPSRQQAYRLIDWFMVRAGINDGDVPNWDNSCLDKTRELENRLSRGARREYVNAPARVRAVIDGNTEKYTANDIKDLSHLSKHIDAENVGLLNTLEKQRKELEKLERRLKFGDFDPEKSRRERVARIGNYLVMGLDYDEAEIRQYLNEQQYYRDDTREIINHKLSLLYRTLTEHGIKHPDQDSK